MTWGASFEPDPILFGELAHALQPLGHRASAHPLGPARLMGIVNVTPDSFSDGGRFLESAVAISHGLRLADEGAHYLDVGGESTRPGSDPVPAAREIERVVPVIAGLAGRLAGREPAVLLSVDTRKAAVAAAALDAGATIVNDVSAGLADPDMLPLVAERGAGYCAMHMRGTPKDMQEDPRYEDVVAEVLEFLRGRVAACLEAGIALSKIAVDPGIGFGKRLEHNLALLRRLPELRSLGLPLVVGVSRKSFLARIERDLGGPELRGEDVSSARLGATAAAVACAVQGGASILRVHDVLVCGRAARFAHAFRDASYPPVLGDDA